MSMYITLLACGLFLIGIEIFVPGGVLGIFGAAALIGAAVMGFTDPDFANWFGWVSLLVILTLTGLALFAWMKYLPKSPIGKALSLAGKTKDLVPEEEAEWQKGMTGSALCELRPAGKAMIDDRRADVIADKGTWIAHDAPIEIVRVAGNRIYVKEIEI
jgi:membrane-bound ClpP family serine protease